MGEGRKRGFGPGPERTSLLSEPGGWIQVCQVQWRAIQEVQRVQLNVKSTHRYILYSSLSKLRNAVLRVEEIRLEDLKIRLERICPITNDIITS